MALPSKQSWVCNNQRPSLGTLAPMFGVVNWDLSHSVGPPLAWLRLALAQQTLCAPANFKPLLGEILKDLRPCWSELLKLGIDVGQTSVAKYMARRKGPPSQGWKTFPHNHADGIAAMDLF